jgi:hypothetical protein
MRPADLFSGLRRRDPVLFVAGAAHFALLLLMGGAALLDDRTVLGLNPWVKPMKFAASIGLYLWTVGWLLGELPPARRGRAAVRWATVVAMISEMALIGMQAARGTTSHYNIATVFDAAVFSTMGLMIMVNTVAAVCLLLLFCPPLPALPRAYAWGIRLGLLVFVLGSLEAMVMILRQAHTVGLPDGGPGLPLVNWSTRGGDLRIAHLLGLHALQVFPLVGFLLGRHGRGSGLAPLVAFVAVYVAAFGWLFWQALHGRPLLAM